MDVVFTFMAHEQSAIRKSLILIMLIKARK